MRKFLLMLVFLFLFSFGSIAFGNPAKGQERPLYYEQVQIEKGDTVWGIAKRYLPENRNTKEFVKEIMQFNQMITAKILPGQSILIPIYGERNSNRAEL